MTINKILGLLVGFALLIPGYVSAAIPSDYGLREGNTISASNSSDPDVYIVNEHGYKRLFVNPAIFNLYGHLGGFASVKQVSPAVRDAFPTSGLFRVDGEQKVYGLEVTGEDVAVLRWVNTTGAQAVIDDPNFFKKVFVINQAEKNLYGVGADYTSVTQVPAYVRGGVVTPVGNSVSVSSVVSSQTITRNAQGFSLLNVSFNGVGTVNSLVVKRVGFGSHTDFDGVYLVKDGVRLTNPKSMSSSDEVTFSGLSLKAPFVLSVVADFNGTPQNIAKVELSGSYPGLPIRSNDFTFAAATSGTVSITHSGSADTVVVGQKDVKVGQFDVKAGSSEDVTVKKLYLYNGGSADISRVRLSYDSSVVYGTLVGDKYVFDLNTVIKTDKTKKFDVIADIDSDARAGETVKISLEEDYDLVASGNSYGFGVTVTNTFTGVAYTVVDSGKLEVSTVTGDNVVALWEDTKVTLFQFKAKTTDETFSLNEFVFGGLNSDIVKRLYVYQDSTLVGYEDIDGSVATVSADFDLTGEKTFTVKADFVKQDTTTNNSFTPSLTAIHATGVGSDSDVVGGSATGKPVYVYAAYPAFSILGDNSNQQYIANVETSALKFRVTAFGGDIRLASTSSPFTFSVTENAVAPFVYRIEVDGDEVASGSQSPASSLTFAGVFSDDVVVAKGQSVEVEVFVTYGPRQSSPIFHMELKDVAGGIQWQDKDSDDEYVSVSSVVKTLKTLPLKGPNFVNL